MYVASLSCVKFIYVLIAYPQSELSVDVQIRPVFAELVYYTYVVKINIL